jgi:hypothetical protein
MSCSIKNNGFGHILLFADRGAYDRVLSVVNCLLFKTYVHKRIGIADSGKKHHTSPCLSCTVNGQREPRSDFKAVKKLSILHR